MPAASLVRSPARSLSVSPESKRQLENSLQPPQEASDRNKDVGNGRETDLSGSEVQSPIIMGDVEWHEDAQTNPQRYCTCERVNCNENGRQPIQGQVWIVGSVEEANVVSKPGFRPRVFGEEVREVSRRPGKPEGSKRTRWLHGMINARSRFNGILIPALDYGEAKFRVFVVWKGLVKSTAFFEDRTTIEDIPRSISTRLLKTEGTTIGQSGAIG